ncbi:C99L2 protein, partial [Glaucidium brasilianum]|nr:C99L2 protein [Glaucidium brasilianum]
GNFDDSELYDSSLPKGGGDGSDSNGKVVGFLILKNVHFFFFPPLSPASQGAVAGIVSAVVATVIGAVSSFIAYQKKKLCFKQSGKNS